MLTHTQLQLPLLEESLAFEVARYSSNGISETEWRRGLRRMATVQPHKSVPNAHASNRLEQAVANLKAAQLWPW